MINIDKQTIPFCLIKEKTMEWGEIYYEYNPMFIIILTEKNLSLKESIIFLEKIILKTNYQIFIIYYLILKKKNEFVILIMKILTELRC